MSVQPVRLSVQPINNIQQPRLISIPSTISQPPPKLISQPLAIVTPSPVAISSGYKVTAEDYKRYATTRDHIYDSTDSYIGNDEQMPRVERTLDLTNMKFVEEEIHLPEGVENIFVEVSSNAGDNVAMSIRHGIDPGEVTIKMDRQTISVRNGGIPIPIEIHPKEQMCVPQLIFGVLHSSSHYDKNKVRTECGKNGYGAKLTNIFSKEFMVTIGDPNNKKWYRQIWSNNMLNRSEPEIKDYTGESFVEVVFKLDHQRFKYEEYPDEAFRLFARHAADMSFTQKIPVTFNGIKLNTQNCQDYAKLYLGEEAVKKSITYYQWPEGTKIVTKKNGLEVAENNGAVPIVEICAVDSPDSAVNVSFVNGKWTRNGGIHADAAFKAVSKGVLDTVNGGKKGKKVKTVKLTTTDVKNHISMFVSCWVGDPKFDNQYKTALRSIGNSKTYKITIDDKILQPTLKWDLVNRLYAELEAKHFRASKSTDGKKRKYLSDLKGEDANDAGTTNSHNCTLYVTEGKSAMGFAVTMLSLYEKGRDFIGLLPLKGKPLNVMNAPPLQVAENAEINEIKKMLGLRERINYLDEENFNTLRYGHLMILADADTDGKHILGLVLNLFHCKYPSLLARGFVKYLRTKIIDVTKGGQTIKFYSNNEYETWKTKTNDWDKWEHKYYKGLGSSKDADIAEEFKAPKIVQCFYDDIAPVSMELAFHEKLADQRKEWIKNWQPDFRVEEMQMQPISAFINHELIQFSIADIARSIPRFMDGLKQVQRKAIWGSMKKWKKSAGKKAAEVKVGNLAAYVSEKTEYHHGPKSLCDTIVNMVHDFTGSNNLPFFCADGQFGCLDPDTPVLMYDQTLKLAKDIKVGDELVGDDKTKRTVLSTVKGYDDMYKINQSDGDSYVVNSIHMLSLKYMEHKRIENGKLKYYDQDTKNFIELNISAEHNIEAILSKIPDDNVIDIQLDVYLKSRQIIKDMLRGFTSDLKLTKITVEYVGVGKYSGWQLDGNERFLLADGTVTHNTRNMLGKDAADARYTKTRPQWWWKYMFKSEDNPLLQMVVDEGKVCEPEAFLPILPLHLINGSNGIATGHSTFIPNHDPLDICQWITCKINGYPLPPVLPWYRGFKGTIKLAERGKKAKNNPDETTDETTKPETVVLKVGTPREQSSSKEPPVLIPRESPIHEDIVGSPEDSDEDDALGDDTTEINNQTKYTMITTGSFEVSGNARKKIVVTELPIGRSMHDYDKWLAQQRDQKNIAGYSNYSKANTVHFEITGMKSTPSHKNLRLIRSFGMSNMVLLDMNNRPVKYDTTIDIMETFYALRLPWYQKRKDNILKEKQEKIDLLNNKIKFIIAVIHGHNLIKANPGITINQVVGQGGILTLGLNKKDIIPQMQALGHDAELLKKVNLYHCTLEELETLREDLQKLLNEKGLIEEVTPQKMWQNDIDEFVAAYCREYKCKPTIKRNVALTITK